MVRVRIQLISFGALLAAAAAFVWLSSAALPPRVASHFAASGAADGFMPHAVYANFMLAMVVGTPLFLALLPFALIRQHGPSINIPNRDYWLAPERVEQTVARLRLDGLWLATFVLAFLAYVHWLVIDANRLQPPHLAASAIIGGLVGLLAALVAWLATLVRRFRLPPARPGGTDPLH